MTLVAEKQKLSNLVSQYRCPKGDEGIAIGEFFNERNSKIIKESIKALNLEDKNRVLELGHGNCSHLPFLMEQALHVKYFGMEISEIMIKEAARINEKYTKANEALFQPYDGERVPYVHNIFDRILTINTIYFWENPIEYLKEMFRVLKPGGKFVLTYTNSNLLKELSLVENNDVFELYNKQTIKELIIETEFILNSIEEKTERSKDRDGNWVDRDYTIVVLSKKERNRFLEI